MTKIELRRAVQLRDVDAIQRYAKTRRRALSVLFSMTFDSEPLKAWRAAEAVGHAAKIKAQQDLEKVRDFLRRCIWMMTDESGGLGWRAPEVIGEVLFQVPVLIPEFGALLFHYFEESPFERGAVAAVSRIAALAPTSIVEHREKLEEMMAGEDVPSRAYAVIALLEAGVKLSEANRKMWGATPQTASIFDHDTGQFQNFTFESVSRAAK